MLDIACLHLTSLPLVNGTLSVGRVDVQLAGHRQISISSNNSHRTEGGLPVSICCAVIITAVRKRLIRKKEFKQINICLCETVEILQCISLFALLHNKTVAERETKYSQTLAQQSSFGNGIRVTVIYTAGDRYIQVNFAENIKATENFGKLSGDRNIQGDCYIQGERYIQVNFAENIIKATENFGKLSSDCNIQGNRVYTGQLCRKYN